MADVKNFGLKGIGDDVQLGKSGGRQKWSSANTRFEFYESDGSHCLTSGKRRRSKVHFYR